MSKHFPLKVDGFAQRIYCANGDLFATVAYRRDQSEQAAWAALIAAAPDLLDALQELLAASDNSVNPANGDDVAAMLRYGNANKAARGIVAKVTGAQP